MKILLESHQLFSHKKTGVGYYENVLVSRLKKAGTSIAFGTFSDTDSSKEELIISRLSHRVALKLLSYGIRVPAEKLWKIDADAYIFPDFFLFPSQKPSAVVIHDLTYLKNPDYLPGSRNKYFDFVFPALATVLKRTIPFSLQHAKIVLVTSHAVKNELIESYNIPKEKFVVSGIPPEEAYFTEKASGHLPKLPTKKFIYYQATLEPRKNHLSLLKAYHELPKKLQAEYSLVLGGRVGWKCDETLKFIKEMQLDGKNVVHLDYVSDKVKRDLYEKASLYVQPSHYEGFGMPLLEAMACKTPVICSDIPVFREVCDNAALYFDKDDPVAIADILQQILTDTNQQRRLIKNGQKRVDFYRNDTTGINLLIKKLSLKS